MFKSSVRACFLFGASLLVAPLSAQIMAGPAAETAPRILSDPTYLPYRGQLLGDTSYGYDWGHASSYDVLGLRSHVDSHSSTIRQAFSFGLTDDLTINVADSYEWSRSSRYPFPDGDIISHRHGFNDPTFGATWRALDELHGAPVDLDLSAAYSPDIIRSDAPAPAYGYSGSIARGGDLLTLRAAAGLVTPFYTVQGYVSGAHYGSADTHSFTDFINHQSSYWQPAIGVNTQFRTGRRVSFNVDGSYDFRSHSFTDVGASDTTYRLGRAQIGTVEAVANYHFVPNRVVGSLGYDHSFYGHDYTDYLDSEALSYVTSRSANAVTARLLYTF